MGSEGRADRARGASCVRDLIRQIALEHEIAILSGKVASDDIHVLVAYRPHLVSAGLCSG
jgi:hypothetical protein